MPVPRFKAVCKNGAIWFDRPNVVSSYLAGLSGKVIEVVVQPWRESKTLSQLAYFHGPVLQIGSEASGYEKNELKDLLKRQFLTYHLTTKKGQNVELVPSLADVKKDVMSRFIDDSIRLIAKEFSAVVPPPDDVNF